MAKYGKKAQKKVETVMHEFKEGILKSGRSGKVVKSRKQAVAIGLSEARKEGDKVPSLEHRNRKSKASVMKKAHRKGTTSPRKSRKGGEKTGSKKRGNYSR